MNFKYKELLKYFEGRKVCVVANNRTGGDKDRDSRRLRIPVCCIVLGRDSVSLAGSGDPLPPQPRQPAWQGGGLLITATRAVSRACGAVGWPPVRDNTRHFRVLRRAWKGMTFLRSASLASF